MGDTRLFNPSEQDRLDFQRRVFNGIKSLHLATLIERAVTHALQDPEFVTKHTPQNIQNLKVIYEV